MREVANLRRNEEGVSAAIATVLLFAGVLSLDSLLPRHSQVLWELCIA